jgi:hypothetical protein
MPRSRAPCPVEFRQQIIELYRPILSPEGESVDVDIAKLPPRALGQPFTSGRCAR